MRPPKRWGGKSQTPEALAARPLAAGQVLCAVSASPSVQSGAMFLLSVLPSWASSHPLGVDVCY